MSTTDLGMPTVRPAYAHRGLSNLTGTEPFPRAAAGALADATQRESLRHATTTIRDKRARTVREVRDFQKLRDTGSAVKRQVTDHLPELLEQFERNVVAAGGHVHWARDAAEAGEIVTRLVLATGERDVVKVKSMATQEIGLNEVLEHAGIAALETDLAELIVQLAGDTPSHILVPAIHFSPEQIRDLFLAKMPGVDPDLSAEPAELAEAARSFLRKTFLEAKVAISGANFAIADTGTLVVVESEGNGRMCLTVPETLISVVGIEKLLPTFEDLEVFLQLLPRSSTAERMNPYTTLFTGVTEGDGPQEFHVVLLDNGRSAVLADPVGRPALHCIRCSACLNVCPVYERTGGHAYGSTYPGPIGAILSPQMTGFGDDDDPNRTLPYASSLCGACNDVCPVRIDFTGILTHLRQKEVDTRRGGLPGALDLGMKAASRVMSDARLFRAAGTGASAARFLPGTTLRHLPPPASHWTGSRDLNAPSGTFHAWWEERQRARGADPADPTPAAPEESAPGEPRREDQ